MLRLVTGDRAISRGLSLKFKGGIATYVADLNANKTLVSDVIAFAGRSEIALGQPGLGELRGDPAVAALVELLSRSRRAWPIRVTSATSSLPASSASSPLRCSTVSRPAGVAVHV